MKSWEKGMPRPQFLTFKKSKQSQPWFDCYDIGNDIIAIYEPYQFQEVISYLIKGKDKALLLDTGLGVGKMKEVVSELWNKDYMVVNSHRHFDHVGGNYEFDEVHIYNHPKMYEGVVNECPKEKWENQFSIDNVSEASPIKDFPYFHGFPKKYICFDEGYVFDLGNRKFKVIHTPGHSDESVMLVNEEEKLLFTGDTFYNATLYCFEGTFETYIETMKKLSEDYYDYTLITSHNEPYNKGSILKDVYKGFLKIKNGEKKPDGKEFNMYYYQFENFSFIKK